MARDYAAANATIVQGRPVRGTADYYRALLDNPNVQRMLAVIRHAEGTASAGNPYAVVFGGNEISDLSRHPGIRKGFRQTDGKSNTTTAAGAYQFLERTWDGLAKKLNLPDFGQESQDIAALALADEKRALPAMIDGDVDRFVTQTRKIWASFPGAGYAQKTRSMKQMVDWFAEAGGDGARAAALANARAKSVPGRPLGGDDDVLTRPVPVEGYVAMVPTFRSDEEIIAGAEPPPVPRPKPVELLEVPATPVRQAAEMPPVEPLDAHQIDQPIPELYDVLAAPPASPPPPDPATLTATPAASYQQQLTDLQAQLFGGQTDALASPP